MAQVSIKYTIIFHCKILQSWLKFGFLVWKQTIWQPWFLGQTKSLGRSADFWRELGHRRHAQLFLAGDLGPAAADHFGSGDDAIARSHKPGPLVGTLSTKDWLLSKVWLACIIFLCEKKMFKKTSMVQNETFVESVLTKGPGSGWNSFNKSHSFVESMTSKVWHQKCVYRWKSFYVYVG
jgi:hypothetical protein